MWESTFGMVKRRFAPWRLYSSAEFASLTRSPLGETTQADSDRDDPETCFKGSHSQKFLQFAEKGGVDIYEFIYM